MKNEFVTFDDVWERVRQVVGSERLPEEVKPLCLVRDLYGTVRIMTPDDVEGVESVGDSLHRLASRLGDTLGSHGASGESRVLSVSPSLFGATTRNARQILRGVYFVDRLVTGRDWWTVGDTERTGEAQRLVLYSVKGGVGRSTTAAVLARHLARRGERVLLVDLDLESPGLSSEMLGVSARPKLGITDWFVEDLVGQSGAVVQDMIATPVWTRDLIGDVQVVPAHGCNPGEYLAKLGRVYIDTRQERWGARLRRLLAQIEAACVPTVVLIESRSGIHDIAAATVTDLNADVLLFAIDSASHWAGYDILFRHWQEYLLADKIRERLYVVSSLTPELNTERYLRGFRERSWNLFRERLYDDVLPSGDTGADFSYDLDDEDAPHFPMPVHWTRGLAAGASLRELNGNPVRQAYAPFLDRFNHILKLRGSRQGG